MSRRAAAKSARATLDDIYGPTGAGPTTRTGATAKANEGPAEPLPVTTQISAQAMPVHLKSLGKSLRGQLITPEHGKRLDQDQIAKAITKAAYNDRTGKERQIFINITCQQKNGKLRYVSLGQQHFGKSAGDSFLNSLEEYQGSVDISNVVGLTIIEVPTSY